MMLTTRGRYAVMAMVDLAWQDKAKPVALADIAVRQGIALNYLEQIFARLRKSGIVESVRGPGGGYLLAQGAGNIRIAHIISAVEEQIVITRCKTEAKGCVKENAKCLTHDLWEGLDRQIHAYLDGVTLEDVKERRLKVG